MATTHRFDTSQPEELECEPFGSNPDENEIIESTLPSNRTLIRHSFSDQRIRQLISRGVDYGSFMKKRTSFALEESLETITTEIPGTPVRNYYPKRQAKSFKAFYEKPFTGNHILAISSYPTDLRAKHLALYLMNRAMDIYSVTTSRRIRSKAPPLWHRVYGGFKNLLLDSVADNDSSHYPCFLVISNTDINSTSSKLEKVRDLLDRFSDIPRIVVTTPQDPISFFALRLHYMVSAGIYLSPARRQVTL